METQQQALLGVLGGMGPLATVDFLGKLTRLLPARCDQDHVPWITISQPGMPDRSQAIQDNHDGPSPYLTKGVAYLAAQGVKLICIPCSTSHFWFAQMQAASAAPIVHIADATIEELKQSMSGEIGVIAILATRGTIKAGIYSERLLKAGFTIFELNEAEQTMVDQTIRDVKLGNVRAARKRMRQIHESLVDRGVKLAILGCTELPLVYDGMSAGLFAIDPSLALAKTCLRQLGYLPEGGTSSALTASSAESLRSI